MAKILVIDDEGTILKVLSLLLKTRQHEVLTVDGGEPAKSLLLSQEFDLLLSDIRMNPIDGLQFLQMAQEKWPTMPVVMMTGYTSMATVTQAVKLGAFDYIVKPLRPDELMDTVDRALDYGKILRKQKAGLRDVEVRHALGSLIGESEPMRKVCELIKRVAPTPTTILLCGEKGVGKSMIARTIHDLSRRKDENLVEVDCVLLKDGGLDDALFGNGTPVDDSGAFQAAARGTIFLERVESIGADVQQKLLGVLKNRCLPGQEPGQDEPALDVRVLAASDMELRDLVEAGLFLEELYDRLRLLPIAIAPLRERREDLLPTVVSLIRELTGQAALPVIETDVIDALTCYGWPGNLSELELVLRDILPKAKGNQITKDLLPGPLVEAAAKATPLSGRKEDSRYKALRAFLQAKGTMPGMPAKPASERK